MRTSKFFSDKIVLFLAVCVVLSFLCQIFKFTAPVNILYVATLLLVLFCYIYSGYASKITIVLTLLICLASFVNGFRYNELDYYTHILITICIFICIEVGPYVKLSVHTFKKISSLFLVISIILLLYYYWGPLKTTYFDYHIGSVSLNFANPNAAGLWLTCLFILLLYTAFLFKKFKRVLYAGVALGMLPIILATQARNSFLACILFLVGLVAAKIFRIKKVPNWILVVLATLPLIVFVFYMFVIVNNMDFWESLFSLDSIDKGIDSRKYEWQKVIDNFRSYFLLGDYYRYYNDHPHNSLLTIFCRFGAPATTLACVSIYRALKNLQQNASFYAVLSLSALLFTGCFEASVFVGIAGLYLMLLLLPACASVESIGKPDASAENLLPNLDKKNNTRFHQQ